MTVLSESVDEDIFFHFFLIRFFLSEDIVLSHIFIIVYFLPFYSTYITSVRMDTQETSTQGVYFGMTPLQTLNPSHNMPKPVNIFYQGL